MGLETDPLHQFLLAQSHSYGAKDEIEPGHWVLFAIENSDLESSTLAQSLLNKVEFPFESGQSDDDQYTIHYVETEHRAAAIYWLDNLLKRPLVKSYHPALSSELSSAT